MKLFSFLIQGSRYGALLDGVLDRYFSNSVPRVSHLLQKNRIMRDPGNEIGILALVIT